MAENAANQHAEQDRAAVSVLGLGDMGTALAMTLVERGHPTTVWNRTAAKANPLVTKGATQVSSPVDAVSASPLVLVCLLDHAAVRQVLETTASALAGKTVANLTSQTPDQARSFATWVVEQGATYLGGGIMAGAEQIGTPDAHLYYSGPSDSFAEHRATLEQLGGATKFFGDDPGLAPLHHCAVTALGFELWASYLHTAALFATESVEAAAFTPLVVAVSEDMVAALPMLAEAVDSRTYPPDLGTVRVQAALMGDLIDTREARGVDAEQLRRIHRLMTQRLACGRGDNGFSSLIEEITPSR